MKQNKNIITLEVDSALSLMQEIYNDIVEQKNYASMIMKKMMSFMKDQEDMSTIGPVIKEQQKILNECTEKKISLVKLQGILLKQTQGMGSKGMSLGKLTLTEEERKILDDLVKDTKNDNETNNYQL
jgi:hypothetical protein